MMRTYRALLHAYPASFRAGVRRGDVRRSSAAVDASERIVEIAELWLRALAEVFANAAAAHWDILRQDLRYTARTLREVEALRSRRLFSWPSASEPTPRRSP